MNTAKITPIRSLVFLGAAAALLASSLLFASSGARADTASTTPPVLSNVIVTPSDTGATITWNSDQAATGQVVYGLTSTYDASSTLDSTLGTSHTAFLGGLTPGTTYHYQIQSNNASGTAQTLATTVDATFMTTGSASSTASTTVPVASTTTDVAPVISNIVSTTTDTTATITWATDKIASTQVLYGLTSAYGSMSTFDSTGVLNHSVVLMGLSPNTLYHFEVVSNDASSTSASSTDMTFMTGMTMATSTPPPTTGSTTLDMLQAQIEALKLRVTALENFIAGLGGGTGTTTPPTGGGGTGTIDQNGASINAGGSIDFTGRNFGHEESVTVSLNGTTVTTAHADGGGNFSTGSIAGPSSAGTYTYTFTGANSGITGSATVTVH